MGNKRMERGLEEISNIFLSSGHRVEKTSHLPAHQCKIEETVTVSKRLIFYNSDDVQQNIERSLTQYLEKGYRLKRVCLQKKESISKPRAKIHKEEEVIIVIK